MGVIEVTEESTGGIGLPPPDRPEDISHHSTILEALLLCMSPDQRANLLAAFADGIVYINRVPLYDKTIPLKLTKTAQDQLQAILNELLGTIKGCSEGSPESLAYLKADLEAGVRLGYRRSDAKSSDVHEKGVRLKIQSSEFVISCRLYLHTNRCNASLIATHIERSLDPKAGNISQPLFAPCTWDVLPYDLEAPLYFDTAILQRIAAELSCKLRPVAYNAGTRDHLALLEFLIGVNGLAMKYQYEVLTREGDQVTLKIQGPQERIKEIKKATIYTEGSTSTLFASNPQGSKQIDSLTQWQRLPMILQRPEAEEATEDDDVHTFSCPPDGEVPSSGFIMDLGIASQLGKEIRAIASLRNGCRNKSPQMIRLTHLLGPVHFTRLEVPSHRESIIEFFDSDLTEHQRQAVAKALSTPDICLIHGPPGTGKTRVICEVVQQAIARKWTVLLVAPTHVAVDNVLERIGETDDVNAVRCATERKRPDLPEFIQQFTYEERLGELARRCIQKIEQHLKQLHRRRLQIGNAARVLKEILSFRADLATAESRRETLRETLSLLPQSIRGEFKDTIERAQAIQDAATLAHSESEKYLETARLTLHKARDRAGRICLESYSSNDTSRFKAAEEEVNRLHKKKISTAAAHCHSAKKQVAIIESELAQVRSRLAEATEILHDLDSGTVPAKVEAAIRKVIARLSAQHRGAINAGKNALEEAKNERATYQKTKDDLARHLALVRTKLINLPEVKSKPLWKRLGRLMWWEALLIDYKRREEKCLTQLKDLQGALVASERRVESTESALQEARENEARELGTARLSELERLHESYKSQCHSLPAELDALEQQLKNDRLRYGLAQDAVDLTQKAYQDALQSAVESTRQKIRKDAAGELKEVRRRFQIATERCHQTLRDLNAAKEDVTKLDDQINEITEKRRSTLDEQLQQLNTVILQYKGAIDRKERTAEQLLGFSVPSSSEEIEGVIKELPSAEPEMDVEEGFLTEWRKYVEREGDELGRRLAGYVNLICATTIGIASDDYFGDGAPLEQKEFDLLILDEAGKVTEPEFLVAATRAKRWILLGDHKQLPPYYDRRVAQFVSEFNAVCQARGEPELKSTILRESYFERFWEQLQVNVGKYSQATELRREFLDTQRRMHPHLALFISDMFYDSQYNSPSDLDFVRSKSIDLAYFSYPVTFIEVCPRGRSRGLEVNLKDFTAVGSLGLSKTAGYANLEEAKQVVRVLESLVNDEAIHKEQDELDESNDRVPVIGVISFYTGQVELIRRLIMKSRLIDAHMSGNSSGEFLCKGRIRMMVNSVDSFQGRECPIIILSFTRSNPYRNIGFVDDPNRLNVAMSRARKKLILIGDTKTFLHRSKARNEDIEDCNSDASIQIERDFFVKLMTYIEGHGEFKQVFQMRESRNETS